MSQLAELVDTQPEMAAVEGKTRSKRAKTAKPTAQSKGADPNWFLLGLKTIWGAICEAVRYVVSFQWVVDLTQWLISTGGKVAESAFLLATTYVIVNLVAHKLVLWMVFENTNVIDTFNQIAMIAFSVLPELIAIAAIIRSFEQWKYLFLTRRIEFLIWALLFTAPTIVFAVMTIITINGFVSLESAGQIYSLSPDSLHWRVISGWCYGCCSMLYAKIGKGSITRAFDDLVKNLSEREGTIKEFQGELKQLNAVIESQSRVIDQFKHQNLAMEKSINKSSEMALEAYSEACIEWLKSEAKSVFIDEITHFTGHSKRRIKAAIQQEKLAVTTRNDQRVLKSSLIEWLKENLPKEEETGNILRVVNQ